MAAAARPSRSNSQRQARPRRSTSVVTPWQLRNTRVADAMTQEVAVKWRAALRSRLLHGGRQVVCLTIEAVGGRFPPARDSDPEIFFAHDGAKKDDGICVYSNGLLSVPELLKEFFNVPRRRRPHHYQTPLSCFLRTMVHEDGDT